MARPCNQTNQHLLNGNAARYSVMGQSDLSQGASSGRDGGGGDMAWTFNQTQHSGGEPRGWSCIVVDGNEHLEGRPLLFGCTKRFRRHGLPLRKNA